MSRSSRKKKEKESRRVVDKFSLKTWYKIHVPDAFGGDQISETPAAEPEYVIGRTLSTDMRELTGDYKKMHVKITFKVHDVKGEQAYTYFYGHEYTRDYIRSMIRRRRTRIDGIFNVFTKDDARVRLSIIALTPFRCKASHERGIRKVMSETAEKRASKLSFDNFIKDVVSGKLATEIYKKARKVHPIQNVDVWKSRTVELPTKKLPDEKPEEPAKESPEKSEEVVAEATQ